MRALVKAYQPGEFDKGQWTLQIEGYEADVRCVNPDLFFDGEKFIGQTIEGKLHLECGKCRKLASATPIALRATAQVGLEGDLLVAIGNFRGLHKEPHQSDRHIVDSAVVLYVDLNEDPPSVSLESGDLVEVEGYLSFSMED